MRQLGRLLDMSFVTSVNLFVGTVVPSFSRWGAGAPSTWVRGLPEQDRLHRQLLRGGWERKRAIQRALLGFRP